MTGRELREKLIYIGMEKELRKLVIDEKMAKPEEVAVMTAYDVCDLVVEQYAVVYAETEEIGLVRKDRLDEYNAMVKCISR